ncbi:rhomboid family intramembrane serine protease [Candidatus Latescibacterota bacterium]
MFPLYSDREVSRLPFVTLFFIASNCVVFWLQITGPGSIAKSVYIYGMIPADLLSKNDINVIGRVSAPLSVVTSVFSHGGFFHLGANMLYLWVFGRNVEDFFGHVRFFIFYLAAGILSALAFAFAFPEGKIPLVGASGAVAGVLGVYFLRYPLSGIHCLIVFFIFVRIIRIPAFIMLGFWFAIQIGASMFNAAASATGSSQSGVAWIAHVAGFVVGLVWAIWELRRQYYERMG